MPRTVLFYRDFRRFTGGHLKLWDYFNHVASAPGYRPVIHFSRETTWDAGNPWLGLRDQTLPQWRPEEADILFLAGLDWQMLSPPQRDAFPAPVINLIQHVRHAQPDDPRFPFLRHKAIRICVSEQVAAAIQGTGLVNGPVCAIPNGIDLDALPVIRPWEQRAWDILVAGLKQPQQAKILGQRLAQTGLRIEVLTRQLPRSEYLDRLNDARITVFLPRNTEGFYLPALEGMALGTLVICPDCVGNRSFCLANRNCLRPEFTVESLLSTVGTALALTPQERASILHNAAQTVAGHSLSEERRAFLDILNRVDQLW